jgi:D-alanyl-D-alanine carboxypeptidase
MVKSTPAIADFMRQSSIEVTQSSGRAVTISATNQLLRSELNAGDYFITAGKTGYIPQAGYCLAVGVQHDNAEVLIVVLGAEDNDARFADASHLASWSFKTFEWSKL